MSQHTQGPWTVENNSIYGNAGMIRPFIASVEDDHRDEETNANARLIAAAPDLLDALQWITRCASIRGPVGTTAYLISDKRMAEVRAAIAKATGVQS